MKPAWTPSQLEALARDRHIVVTANAGAGKTAVLTERFLRIILDDQVDLGRVVAITFTKKAAAEMRARIGMALKSVAEDTEAPATRRQRARSALNRISTARISTFHAFCGTLLRTYADEANLEADVRELLPRETSALINDAISGTVRAWMRDDAKRDRLLALTDELGISSVQQSIASLVSSSERLRTACAWRNGFALTEDVLAYRQRFVTDLVRTAWTSAAQSCLDAILQAGATLKPKGVDTVNALRSAIHGIASAEASTLPQACSAMQDAIDLAITSSKGTLRKDLFEKSGTKTSDATVLSTSRQKNLKTLTEPWSPELERLQVVLSDTLLDIAQEASTAYTQSKRARNGLDFDDLILRSIELLEGNAGVANDVHRNIDHLMIDEFQDTNPAQYHLVSCLVPNIAHTESTDPVGSIRPCPRLFIVGDGKQSIYGFRDADVRLFERAAQAIDAANARSGLPSGRVKLLASFRMAPPCAVAINAICSEIVIKQSEFDVDYDPLVCGRPNVPDGVGSCNVIVTDVTQQRSLLAASNDDDDDGLAAVEAAHVADVIARTISDPAHTLPIQVKIGESRPATAGDIAVLVRGSTGAAAIADALRKRNVRCHVLAGRGFFTRPEIADIRNLLRWSTDRLDDLACMALLRSPLLRCTDEDLHHIACHGKGAMWDRALRARTDPASSERIHRAVALMEQFLVDIRVLPIDTFVRTALSSSEWHRTLVDDPRRDQQLANVEKLLTIIADASAGGATSLRDVIASIEVPVKDNEADEQFDVDPNAVRIMTIHGSKGLDFPVVFLSGISLKGGGTSSVTRMSDSLGLTLRLAEEIPTDVAATELTPRGRLQSHTVQQLLRDSIETAEDRRLLYVALTRVKDHLFVSLPFTTTKKGELGAAAGLAKLLRPFFDERRSLQTIDADGWSLVSTQSLWIDDAETTRVMSVNAPALFPTTMPTVLPRLVADASTFDDLHVSLAEHATLDMISATELLSASHGSDEPSAMTLSDEIDETRGAAYGTVVHYLLQHGARVVGQHSEADLRVMLEQKLASRIITDTVRTSAIDEVVGILTAPFLLDHAEQLRVAGLETSLTAILDGVSIYGVMDVMLPESDGCVEIWDWKTTSIADTTAIDEAAEWYAQQMQVYAWLTMMAHPAVDAVRTRLVFTKARGRVDPWMSVREFTRTELDTTADALRSAIRNIVRRRAIRAGLLDIASVSDR